MHTKEDDVGYGVHSRAATGPPRGKVTETKRAVGWTEEWGSASEERHEAEDEWDALGGPDSDDEAEAGKASAVHHIHHAEEGKGGDFVQVKPCISMALLRGIYPFRGNICFTCFTPPRNPDCGIFALERRKVCIVDGKLNPWIAITPLQIASNRLQHMTGLEQLFSSKDNTPFCMNTWGVENLRRK